MGRVVVGVEVEVALVVVVVGLVEEEEAPSFFQDSAFTPFLLAPLSAPLALLALLLSLSLSAPLLDDRPPPPPPSFLRSPLSLSLSPPPLLRPPPPPPLFSSEFLDEEEEEEGLDGPDDFLSATTAAPDEGVEEPSVGVFWGVASLSSTPLSLSIVAKVGFPPQEEDEEGGTREEGVNGLEEFPPPPLAAAAGTSTTPPVVGAVVGLGDGDEVASVGLLETGVGVGLGVGDDDDDDDAEASLRFFPLLSLRLLSPLPSPLSPFSADLPPPSLSW